MASTEILETVRAVRSGCGLSTESPFGILLVTGEDRASFLDAQLPVNVEALSPGASRYTASLDRKGRISADLLLVALQNAFWILARRELLTGLHEKLESHRFRERVSFRDLATDCVLWELHGPSVPAVLALAAGRRVSVEPFTHEEIVIAGRPVRWMAHPWSGDVGGHLAVSREDAEAVSAALARAANPVALDAEALEVLRIEGGMPRFGKDMDARTLLLELGREDMVSHDKGCYLGQETVARVHSRGHVNRLLVGLRVDGDTVPPAGALLHAGGDPVGETRSATFSPSQGGVIALAMVRRSAAIAGTVVHLKLEEGLVPARVSELPLYRVPGPKEEAERLYREGMEAFKRDALERAESLFQRATLMDPRHAGAFESLGVCQERLGRIDEAIETMEALTAADPENVMAWTNLSRYHAQRGEIEKAEKIKGHVTFLVWKKEAGEKAAERRSREETEKRKGELLERVPLFEQVLELDPDDVVANYGLGRALADLERFEEAVPRFRKAIEGQKDYSMAWNQLGTCLLRLGRTAEAREVLREGIEVATRKGDLVPRRDMARKLEEIEGAGSS